MKDELFAYEMGVSYLITEDFQLAIDSFREALSHNHDFVQAIHNLMFALQSQGTAKRDVLCPRCKHWWQSNVYPNNAPGDFMQKGALAMEYAEVPASTRAVECPECHELAIYTFFLCRSCYTGWQYYNMSQIGEHEGKKLYMPLTMPCSNCNQYLTNREHKTPREIAVFNALVKERPQITQIMGIIKDLEKNQQK